MKIHIITIGDEILIGQIVDTNSAWMARQLNLIGAEVNWITSTSDDEAAIKHALGNALLDTDVVLITGGLGPTKDDITKKCLADFFEVGMVFSEETHARILRLFERWGRSPTPAHKEQCFMPANAVLLKNKMGTAPGMWFEHNKQVVVSMPGVPVEMKYLMEFEVIPRLKERFQGKPIAHRTILTVGEGESRIAAKIEDIESSLPTSLKLAFLPGLGQVRLRLTGRNSDVLQMNRELDDYIHQIQDRLKEFVFGHDTERLEEVVGRILRERGLTLATAESCTGGYLAHRITAIPGASDYFLGSTVAYSNEVKQKQLGVKAETLEKHGAVSEATVKEMVRGALALFGCDIAIAISGIAGPDGGTPDKPVGTIWLAIGNKDKTQTLKLQLGKDRKGNIKYTAVQGLNMIRLFAG
ncbi:MAG: CinA-like protein [Saprospiraceae bacterium]|nr:MAG: CinA-like protein [Saprospiraceae bacterium]